MGASGKTRRMEERARSKMEGKQHQTYIQVARHIWDVAEWAQEGRTDDRKEQLTSAISLQFLDLFVLLPYSLSDVKRTTVFRITRNTGFFDRVSHSFHLHVSADILSPS